MDELLIKTVSEALKFKVCVSKIHDVLKEKGLSEEDIFLCIKAGQLFLDHSIKIDEQLAQRKLPFRRSY